MMVVNLASGWRKGLGAAIFSTGGNIGFALGLWWEAFWSRV